MHKPLALRGIRPLAQGLFPSARRVPPERLVHHHVAWAGRVAKAEHALGKAVCRVFHLLFVQAFRKNQRVVLVCFQYLLAPSFGAKSEQGAPGKYGGRGRHLPEAGHELRVEHLHKARELRRFYALGNEGCYQGFHIPHGAVQVGQCGSRLELPRYGQGMVGKIGKQVDHGQNAHRLPLVRHYNAVDVVAGHEEQGIEKVIVLFAAQQGKTGAVLEWRLVGNRVGHDVAKVARGENSGAGTVAHKDGSPPAFLHALRGVGNGIRCLGKYGRPKSRIADLDRKKALPFAAVAVLGKLAQLVGHGCKKVRAEKRVLFRQGQHLPPREYAKQHFFVGHKPVPRSACGQSATIKGLMLTVCPRNFFARHFTNKALHDQIERINLTPRGKNLLIIAEKKDIGRGRQGRCLCLGQQIKGGMRKVKAGVGHDLS